MIHTVNVNTKAPIGTVLAQIPINPLSFASTRLAQEAELWTRWRPVMLRLEAVTSAGNMITGAYVAGWTADPSQNFDTSVDTIVRASALVPSVTSHISQKIMLNVPCNTSQKWLFCKSREIEDANHGKLVSALSASVGVIASGSEISITFYLTWKVAFDGPNLMAGTLESGIYAESDYEGYYTDSVSDWANGKKLSLKTHAGGNLVPFPSARPQTVYRLDKAATLEYYTSSSSKEKIAYAVLVPNYYQKAFAVFKDKAKATAYATSGDSSNCLDYVSPGPVVSPDNPAWYEETNLQRVRSGEADKDALIEELRQQVAQLKAQAAPIQSALEDDTPGSLGFQILNAKD